MTSIRERVAPGVHRLDRHFRWRGGAVSRIEGLSDAVFALALTLLIVSFDAPRDYRALLALFGQVPAFAICFALLLGCWFHHYLFFRRFGLEDGVVVALNGLFLLVVLIYVYPLRFLFGYVAGLLPGVEATVTFTAEEGRPLILVYGSGYLLVTLLLAAFNLHAWRLRERLGLDSVERFLVRTTIRRLLLHAAVGAFSITLAVAGVAPALAGLSYALIGPVMFVDGWFSGVAFERLQRTAGR